MNEMVVESKENEVVSDVFTFTNPYRFEGQEYKTLDLACLNDLTAGDMVGIDRELMKNGSMSFMNEISLEYSLKLLAKATKKPIEFFWQLPPREATRLKMATMGFLFGRD